MYVVPLNLYSTTFIYTQIVKIVLKPVHMKHNFLRIVDNCAEKPACGHGQNRRTVPVILEENYCRIFHRGCIAMFDPAAMITHPVYRAPQIH